MTQPTPIRLTIPVLTAKDFQTAPRHTILYIGPVKSGKTHNLMSWLAAGPMLLIYFDENTATPAKFLTDEIIVLQPNTTKLLQSQIVPAIQNRSLEKLAELLPQDEGESAEAFTTRKARIADVLCRVVTIGLDSVSFLARLVLNEVRSGSNWTPDQPIGERQLDFEDRARFLGRMQSWLGMILAARKPVFYSLPGGGTKKHPGYNVVMTVHEQLRTVNVPIQGSPGQSREELVEVCPAIEGAFRRELLALFDSVFWTYREEKVERTTQGSTVRDERKVDHYVYTIPPDKFRRAGDGVGGGIYKTLPPRLEGTYPRLMEAWGFNRKQEK